MADKLNDLTQIAENVEGSGNTQNQESLEYSSIYRAKCIDNKDPLKTGRIKIWIPSKHHTKVEETNGIWAYPCTTFAASNLEEKGKPESDIGSLYIPPVNSYVFIFFEDGDSSKPRYFGGVVTEGAIPTENQTGDYYKKHTVIKTPSKRIIFVSDDDSNDACVLIRGKERK